MGQPQFKLWKQHGQLDEWRSAQPWRILCGVCAKLLALPIQRWCLLPACWADPRRRLVGAAQLGRDHAPPLALARGRLATPRRARATRATALPHAGRVTKRRQHPATADRLLAFGDCAEAATAYLDAYGAFN